MLAKLRSPLDLDGLTNLAPASEGDALLIKEMPYQVGGRFPLLAGFANEPLIFLIRDPRLSIASRMSKKREVGDDPVFPTVETGWELLTLQMDHCRSSGIDFLIVDSTDFRNHPSWIFPRVFSRLGLSFSPEMLRWKVCDHVELDNLGGRHRHLYRRVLTSTSLLPATEEIPSLESFPRRCGFRDHVAECVELYREVRGAAERIRPVG